MEENFVSSPAALSASDGDAGGAVDTTPIESDVAEPESPDNEGIDIDALNDTGEADEQEEETPDNQVHEPEAEAEEEPAAAAADATEELPDGVRKGKDRNGKEGLWLTPQRYEQFHGAHKTLRQFEDIAGEQVTPKVFDTYNRAFLGQEKLYGDLLSGDSAAQSAVLKHFLDEGAQALNDGLVGKDPIVSLATSFYGTLKDSHPDAYAALRMGSAKDLVQELYDEAATKRNKSLWDSAGHVAKSLGLPYRKSVEMSNAVAQATDPMASLQKRNQELEAQLNGKQTTNQAAQFDTWHADQKQKVSASLLNDAVLPALAELRTSWEKLPGGKDAFNDLVVSRLHSKVRETLRSDKRFGERIDLLDQNAKRATSAQRRNEIGEQIKQAYTNRAKLAVEAHRAEVEKFANRTFVERNGAAHERRKVAAKHVAPGGGGTPVKRSLVPTNADDFEFATPANLARSMAEVLR